MTADKVTKSYEGCEQFLLSFGKAYICSAAMEFWGIAYPASIPTKHVPPPGIMHQSLDKKKEYFDTVVGEFIDNYVMSDSDLEEIGQYKEWQRQTREAINNDHGYAMTPTYDETEPDVDFPPEALPIDRENADRVR